MVKGVQLVVAHLGTVMCPFFFNRSIQYGYLFVFTTWLFLHIHMMVSNTSLLYVLVANTAAVVFISTVVLYPIILSLVLVASNIIGNLTDYVLHACSHVSILNWSI